MEKTEKVAEEMVETASPSPKPGWGAALQPALINSPAGGLGKVRVRKWTWARPGSHGQPKMLRAGRKGKVLLLLGVADSACNNGRKRETNAASTWSRGFAPPPPSNLLGEW